LFVKSLSLLIEILQPVNKRQTAAKIIAQTLEKPAFSALFLAMLSYLCRPVKKPGIILCHLKLLNN